MRLWIKFLAFIVVVTTPLCILLSPVILPCAVGHKLLAQFPCIGLLVALAYLAFALWCSFITLDMSLKLLENWRNTTNEEEIDST
jgi:hypothetical protein